MIPPSFSPSLGALAALALAAVAFAQWRGTALLAPRLRAVLLGLRLLAAAGLALLALNPGRWVVPEAPARAWALLRDRSASMTEVDTPAGSRHLAARRLEEQALALSARPEGVLRHTYGDRLETTPSDALPDAPATDLVAALDELLSRGAAARTPLSGVLVLGDGRQTRRSAVAPVARRALALGTPVHIVPFGGPVHRRDLSLAAARAHTAGLAGHAISLRATVTNRGLGLLRPQVRLLDETGQVVAAAPLEIPKGESRDLSLAVPAPAAGTAAYTWEVAPPEEDDRPGNERATVLVTALPGPLRLLLLEGLPHWDTKFLAQLLRRHAAFALTTVHRLGPGRFHRVGPAEAGAGNAEEEGEAFPADDATLFAYDLVILGRGLEHVLTPEHTARLLRFLRDQGGGLLFARGAPAEVEIPGLADLEPVEWSGLTTDVAAQWAPTPTGREAGLFGGALPGLGDPAWSRLPPLSPQHRLRALRPFAGVLAQARAGDTAADPFLAIRRVGRGASAVVNVREFWRWDFFAAAEEGSAFYQRFWPELALWLALRGDYLPGQRAGLALDTDTARPGETLGLTVHQRVPADGPPSLRLLPVDGAASGAAVEALLQPGREPGRWNALLTAPAPGLYRVEAGPAGHPPAVAALRVLPPPGEGEQPSADPDALRALAEACGGGLVAPEDLPALIRTWESAPAAADNRPPQFVPAWDRGWIFTLIAAALAGEWWLRRRNGLS